MHVVEGRVWPLTGPWASVFWDQHIRPGGLPCKLEVEGGASCWVGEALYDGMIHCGLRVSSQSKADLSVVPLGQHSH